MNPEELKPESNFDQHSDQLQWLAFCYVSEELTSEQRQEFESRLSTDLEAQEALASVVELGRSIYEVHEAATALEHGNAVCTLVRTTPRKTASSIARWRSLATVAAVVTMCFIGYGIFNKSNPLRPITASALIHPADSVDFHTDDLAGQSSTTMASAWIQSLDSTETEIAETESTMWEISAGRAPLAPREAGPWETDSSESNLRLIEQGEDHDLGVDVTLVSFYSTMLDAEPSHSLDTESGRPGAGVGL